MRLRLLDLYCGAGGATAGYQRAGYQVFGVDIAHQPNYCGSWFVRMDALEYLKRMLDEAFAGPAWPNAIHASPPCQRYIRGGLSHKEKHPDLIGPTRDLLEQTGLPWVIENVPGAPMRVDTMLCGSMFGLDVRRHRWFEFSWGETPFTAPCDHSKPVTGVYGNAHGKAGAWPGMLPSDLATWSRAMGIDWMTTTELADAIPPAYTEFVGAGLRAHLEAVAA